MVNVCNDTAGCHSSNIQKREISEAHFDSHLFLTGIKGSTPESIKLKIMQNIPRLG